MTGGESGGPAAPGAVRARLRAESLGLVLLAGALLFNALFLVDEARVGALPVNDDVFHSVATRRLGEAIGSGEPFLDPWVAEWGLGFPVWRSYQPLPHLAAVPAVLAAPPARRTEAFAWFAALVRGLLPLSVWAGARLLGLPPLSAGIASLLVLLPSSPSSMGQFGLGSGAYLYVGTGVYTQQFAFLLLPLALGAIRRALDTGRQRLGAAALLAATLLSHIVFGYVGALAAVLFALVGPGGERPRRLARLVWVGAGSIVLTAWFVVPLALSRAEINHSAWELAWKWDSFGARAVVGALLDGTLLDTGRLQVLTMLLALSAAGAAACREDPLVRRLLALAAVLLALFMGRDTWGHLLLAFGVPSDLHLHRLEAAFELSACLLAAWGAGAALTGLWQRERRAAMPAAFLLGGLVALGLLSRADAYRSSSGFGLASLQGWEEEKGDVAAAVADVRRLMADRPGRLYAGPAAGWGRQLKVGEVPLFAIAALERIDAVSFLYHSMSKAGDTIYRRSSDDPGHDDLFAIRAVVAPAGRPVPAHYREVGRHGKIVVYEASRAGYFGLGDLVAAYTGPKETQGEVTGSWLEGGGSRAGLFVALDGAPPGLPDFGRWQPVPPPRPSMAAPRGVVERESASPGKWQAAVRAERACWVVLKVTWSPDLRFAVDGRSVAAVHVTPGFAAAPLPAGSHVVDVVYRPSALKPALFGGGLLLFAVLGLFCRSTAAAKGEGRLAAAAERAETWIRAAVPLPVAALVALALLSCHALLRGLSVKAHDTAAYPPRLVEFAQAILDGHLPPVWARDLGNGFGQPLFAYSPPLVYLSELPFHLAGLRLADSIQIAALLLVIAGAWATYLLARELPVSTGAAVGAAALWLFVPYLHVDLFVRGAFAEAAALSVAPLSLLAFWRFTRRPFSWPAFAAAAASFGLVVLGHNAVALLFAPALCLLTAAAPFDPEVPWRPAALKAAAALTAGLALSAFFWAPAMVENAWTKTDLLTTKQLAWHLHFPTFGQLLYSPWGFGHSVPGPDDEMSLMAGPLHLLLGAAGCVVGWRRKGAARVLAVGGGAVVLAGLFVASPASLVVWQHVKLLQFFQFPWRALALPALFLPLLAALLLDALPRQAAIAVAAIVVLANLAHTEPNGFLRYDDEYYSPESIASKGLNTTTFEEFESRWVEKRPPRSPLPLSAAPGIDFVAAAERTASRSYVVRLSRKADVEAALFWYPEWRVSVDGSPVPTTLVPVRGTFTFPLEAGEHRITLELTRTPLRGGTLLLSGIVALLLLTGAAATAMAGIAARRKGPTQDGPADPATRVGPGGEGTEATTPTRRRIAIAGVALLLVGGAIAIRMPGRRERAERDGKRQVEIWMASGDDALDRAGEPGLAVSQFRRALEAEPGNARTLLRLAVALDRAGKRDEARPTWERVLALAEERLDGGTVLTARVRLGLAQPPPPPAVAPALTTAVPPAMAQAAIRPATPPVAAPLVAAAPKNQPVAAPEALMKQGMDLLYTKGDPATAIGYFVKVLKGNPSHYGATYQLAVALDRTGKRAEARNLWEKVVPMAEAFQDSGTLATARARLAEKP